MVKYALAFLVAAALIPLAGAVIADTKEIPSAITWGKNLEDAQALAKAAGKPVMVDFFIPT